MPSSTEPAGGFRFDDIPNDMLAAMVELPEAKIATQRRDLARRQRDPAAIAAALDELPAATLGLLGLLLANGGVVITERLCGLARERYEMTSADVHAALKPAMRALLAIPLRTSHHHPGFGIIQPAGELLAPLLDGLDLIELPADAFVAGDPGARNPRTFLAACMATRHVDVRLTNDNRPHRSAVKRLAKQLAIADDVLEEMLLVGWGIGVLRLDDDLLRPDAAVTSAAACGRYPRSPAVGAARARLARGPVGAHELLIWLLRRHDLPMHAGLAVEAFAHLPGFAIGTIDGGSTVAVTEIAGIAAGHVTPSFEVMLPPESRLLDIVQVGACCEWERLDRAIVGRITKLAVTRALAAGGSAAQLLEHLAAASKHPVPQNVAAAIRDWAGSMTAATIATGHVIVVEAGARDRAVAALAGRGARELAPGVFVVDAEESLRELRTALLRAGVTARDMPVASGDDDDEGVPDLADEEVQPSPAAARLRARVGAWRRGAPFEGKRDDFLERARALAPAAATHGGSAEDQLVQWGQQRGVRIKEHTAIYPALVAVLGSLPAELRGRLLAHSKDLPQLLRIVADTTKGGALLRRSGARRTVRRAPPLLWQEVDLRAGIEAAVRAGKALALDVGGACRYLKVERLLQRGQTWMVLGEQVVHGEPLAIKLAEIRAIAALPDDLEAYDLEDDEEADDDDLDDDLDDGLDDDLDDDLDAKAGHRGPARAASPVSAPRAARLAAASPSPTSGAVAAAPRRPWRPGPGQVAPAGHVPCPCGSGERYRNCCRNTASA